MKILSKKEFIISHSFIILGLVFLSIGIYLCFENYFLAWIPLIGGLWTLFGGLCFTAIFIFRKTIKPEQNLQTTKLSRHQKAIQFLRQNKTITNNQYQKLTALSDSYATRDLQELENIGVIEQVGKTGRNVFYQLK
ncbi:hypothetical protein KJ973_01360 [Patescibacteria group bacterium]|nr:hypothetical protein [Patescibacteria group bacterium]MBU1246613.1 hypothetical protein [Patescibacteria group bacterium]MBU1519328.1 hypothetical protein [Patescibacteria group bacterium]MBU1730003.1 hypothetical protein [Patescibacteria group bacterium]MBU1956213.1 hypothetical protein [Patescibacteria group bacterium]